MRLLVALALACVACSRADGEPRAAVEDAKKPLLHKKRGAWIPDPKIAPRAPSCPHEAFCTDDPQIDATSDASELHAECGTAMRIPKSVARGTMANEPAYFAPTITAKQRETIDGACCYTYRVAPCGK